MTICRIWARTYFVGVLACLPAPWSAADADVPAAVSSSAFSTSRSLAGDRRVAGLIEALGSERYVERREAEQELLEIGMEAFDQIDAATDHVDPEISASCRFLVSEMTVRWTRRDDPPQVKKALTNYAGQPDSYRISVVTQLGARGDRWAIAPLCRICRYDPTPEVARQAAIALLRTDEYPLDYTADDAAMLRYEIGTSVRPQADWVRLLAAQIDDPRSVVDAWSEAVALAASSAEATSVDGPPTQQLSELLRNLVRIQFDTNDVDAALKSVDRLLGQGNVDPATELERLLSWTPVANSTDVLDQLADRYAAQLNSSKPGLYLLARMRAGQGRDQLAKDLADRAFAAPANGGLAGTPNGRLKVATKLLNEGQVEWGRRELRAAIEQAGPATAVQSQAAWALAFSLHDWQLNAEANEVLAAFTKPLRADSDLATQYNRLYEQGLRSQIGLLFPLNTIEANQHYFQACDLGDKGDVDAQWRALEQAYDSDDSNADIIIAMYRASAGNVERRNEALAAIEKRTRLLEQAIDEYPSPAYYSGDAFNEWAWLVSNTEGDFQKAIRYSQKSLDLFAERMAVDRRYEPEDSAGRLDTLGRCYFSAGDIATAIEHQDQAVKYQPHMRVLQRQLDEFRQAQAAAQQ